MGGSAPACCIEDGGQPIGAVVKVHKHAIKDVHSSTQALCDHSLLQAARDGDVDYIRQLLVSRACPQARQPFRLFPKKDGGLAPDLSLGLSPLMHAAQGGYMLACQALLEARAAVDEVDEDSMRPLHFAAIAGSFEVCRLLLEARADPEAQDSDGNTAFSQVPPVALCTRMERDRWIQLFSHCAQGQQTPRASRERPSHRSGSSFGEILRA
mmetsp:Transcript_70945/g.140816  ORF Transcript_70945/g.140816 Transcript_70945/m.140816 type:complete len:211 (-) Transcript_70945:41-673(-)